MFSLASLEIEISGFTFVLLSYLNLNEIVPLSSSPGLNPI